MSGAYSLTVNEAFSTSGSSTIGTGLELASLSSTTINGTLTNQGTLSLSTEIGFADSASTLINQGEVIVTGTLTASSGSATSAVFQNDGILTLASSFGSSPSLGGYSTPAPFTLVNNGTLRTLPPALDPASASIFSSVTNTGSLLIAENTSLSLHGDFVQTDGETVLEGGSLSSANTMVFQGGSLLIRGTVSANIDLSATVLSVAGNSVGHVEVIGDLAADSGTSFVFDITGVTPSTEFDTLAFTGSLMIDGALIIRLDESLVSTLSSTTSFVIVTATDIGGAFINMDAFNRVQTESASGSFLVTISSEMITLSNFSAIPEMSQSALISGLMLLCAALVRRSRRRAA